MLRSLQQNFENKKNIDYSNALVHPGLTFFANGLNEDIWFNFDRIESSNVVGLSKKKLFQTVDFSYYDLIFCACSTDLLVIFVVNLWTLILCYFFDKHL